MTDENDSEESQLSKTATEVAELYIQRFQNNLNRSLHLIQVYQYIEECPSDQVKSDASDVLRAAVVFMHASLEELLRQIAVHLLPHASEDVLNKIPLASSSPSPVRAEKFALGKLKQHESKSIMEVLQESVGQHYERSNFNSTHEISSLLKSLGLETNEAIELYPLIAEMMERRHQIVHRADNTLTPFGLSAQPIDAKTLIKWIKGIMKFMLATTPKAVATHMIRVGLVVLPEDENSQDT